MLEIVWVSGAVRHTNLMLYEYELDKYFSGWTSLQLSVFWLYDTKTECFSGCASLKTEWFYSCASPQAEYFYDCASLKPSFFLSVRHSNQVVLWLCITQTKLFYGCASLKLSAFGCASLKLSAFLFFECA